MTKDQKQELAAVIERCDTHAADLMLAALALSEIMESTNIENKTREDGGRPQKILRAPLEDIAEYITQVQVCAKTAADELMNIKTQVEFYLVHDPNKNK